MSSPPAEEVREQLARIVASPGFSTAGRLPRFLTFLVEGSLAGTPLKESVVGHEVFGRPADYDPRLDPIVRVEARRLRSRLAAYYEGPGADDRVWIELPKGTYVPVCRIRESRVAEPPGDPGAPRQTARRLRRWPWALAAVAAVGLAGFAAARLRQPPPSARPVVAVLPFRDLGEGAPSASFSEGLSEEILDRLSRVPGLKVVARSASFRVEPGSGDLRDVGRRLGATAVVEGSVRRSGDRLRVAARLVAVDTGFQLWSQTYERQAKDVFEIQDRVARSIAKALRTELRSGVEAKPEAPTGSLAAHELYLEGRYHLNHDAFAGLELAIDSFTRATEADPGYAQAHAALAGTYALVAYYRLRPPADAWRQTRAAAARALRLDPGVAEAHAALGLATAHDGWRWQEAEPSLRRAVELDPASSEARVALVWGVLLPRGRTDEALREVDEAVALDPHSALAHQLRSFVLLARGDLREAIAGYRRSVDLNPSHGDIQWDLGMALAYAGEKDAARRQFQVGGSIHSGGNWSPGPIELALLGQPDEARRAIRRWPQFHEQRPLFVAYAYGVLGDAAAAADWLGRAVEERDPQVVWAKVDPRLAAVRSDARIQALIRRVGL